MLYTDEQQCVSKAEFQNVVTKIATVESELNTWQNATINILKRFLLENPGKKTCMCLSLVVVVL